MNNKEKLYKQIIIDLLSKYIESEQIVISDYSEDFKKSAEYLKKEVMSYLKMIDEGEDVFNRLIKGSWIADFYRGE
jgi:alanyl-tRNA synthetase